MPETDDTRPHQDSLTSAHSKPAEAHLTELLGERRVYRVTSSGVLLGRISSSVSDANVPAVRFADEYLSRHQARIEGSGGIWRVTDLGGRNRTYVDGKVLPVHDSTELGDGTLLRMSNTLLVFRDIAPPAEVPDDPLAVAGGPGFPGRSAPAVAVRRRLARLVAATGHVLVVGETGTGKERVARAFATEDRPFVPQNCAELRREFARSELFGHSRGAFSGAVANRPGLVELADGGVLFLDEIGELPLDVQAELLRFLEDGTYRQLGATELRRSSARVVAATNVDLDVAVREGKFRHDLLMRLRASHAPLALPPLRERKEDILPWAELLLEEVAAAARGPWNAGAAECLALFPWNGNLRELRATLRELAAQGLGPSSSSHALPEPIQEHRRDLRKSSGDGDVITEPEPPAAISREQIIAALIAAKGSMRAAAAALGIDRRQLYRLCERHGIDFASYRTRPGKED